MKFSEKAIRSFLGGKLVSAASSLIGLGIVFYNFGKVVGLAAFFLVMSVLVFLEAIVNLIKSDE